MPGKNGGKRPGAGAKLGSRWASTMEKALVREETRKFIQQHMPAMLRSQIAHAIGIGKNTLTLRLLGPSVPGMRRPNVTAATLALAEALPPLHALTVVEIDAAVTMYAAHEHIDKIAAAFKVFPRQVRRALQARGVRLRRGNEAVPDAVLVAAAEAVRSGKPMGVAAKEAGISRNTLQPHLKALGIEVNAPRGSCNPIDAETLDRCAAFARGCRS